MESLFQLELAETILEYVGFSPARLWLRQTCRAARDCLSSTMSLKRGEFQFLANSDICALSFCRFEEINTNDEIFRLLSALAEDARGITKAVAIKHAYICDLLDVHSLPEHPFTCVMLFDFAFLSGSSVVHVVVDGLVERLSGSTWDEGWACVAQYSGKFDRSDLWKTARDRLKPLHASKKTRLVKRLGATENLFLMEKLASKEIPKLGGPDAVVVFRAALDHGNTELVEAILNQYPTARYQDIFSGWAHDCRNFFDLPMHIIKRVAKLGSAMTRLALQMASTQVCEALLGKGGADSTDVCSAFLRGRRESLNPKWLKPLILKTVKHESCLKRIVSAAISDGSLWKLVDMIRMVVEAVPSVCVDDAADPVLTPLGFLMSFGTLRCRTIDNSVVVDRQFPAYRFKVRGQLVRKVIGGTKKSYYTPESISHWKHATLDTRNIEALDTIKRIYLDNGAKSNLLYQQKALIHISASANYIASRLILHLVQFGAVLPDTLKAQVGKPL